MSEAERIAFIRRQRPTPVTAEEWAALAGRVSQRCPDCGRAEAAHFYCSGCFLPMGLADWYHETATSEQKAARQPGRHKRGADASANTTGAKAGPLGLWPA
jgi:hypothetical protein